MGGRTWRRATASAAAASSTAAHPDTDYEIHLDVRIGNEPLRSPDASLDAVIDFVGNAAVDIPRLVAEVHRLRGIASTE